MQHKEQVTLLALLFTYRLMYGENGILFNLNNYMNCNIALFDDYSRCSVSFLLYAKFQSTSLLSNLPNMQK